VGAPGLDGGRGVAGPGSPPFQGGLSRGRARSVHERRFLRRSHTRPAAPARAVKRRLGVRHPRRLQDTCVRHAATYAGDRLHHRRSRHSAARKVARPCGALFFFFERRARVGEASVVSVVSKLTQQDDRGLGGPAEARHGCVLCVCVCATCDAEAPA
jgi:hypothetical protein